jgi:ABC-type glycerol-3-phosphate transport system permease component
LAIFSFIGSWNSFLWPLLMIRQESLYTLPRESHRIQGVMEKL